MISVVVALILFVIVATHHINGDGLPGAGIMAGTTTVAVDLCQNFLACSCQIAMFQATKPATVYHNSSSPFSKKRSKYSCRALKNVFFLGFEGSGAGAGSGAGSGVGSDSPSSMPGSIVSVWGCGSSG